MIDCRLPARAGIAALATAVVAAAAALDPLAFVAGWRIDGPDSAEVFDVPLSAEIYAAADGVEQLAVLDANGDPQSFFRRAAPPAEPTEQRTVLDASPLYADGRAGAPRVGVTTSDGGTAVTVTPGGDAAPAVTGFVLDARAVATVPAALELEWAGLDQPFLLEVVVEQSDDLTSWRAAGRAAVASLSIGGMEVRHARVPVRATAGGYFRITSSGGVAGWRLLRAALVAAAVEPATPLELRLLPLPGGAVEGGPEGALYFDAGGPLPVSSVSLEFGDAGGWLRSDVAVSRSLDGPWASIAARQLFYALSIEGRELASTPLAVGRREARYWRLVSTDAPTRGSAPRLVLGFPQEYLRVAVAGSAPPYQLVAGTLLEEAGPDATLAAVLSSLSPALDGVPVATLGPRRELGGPAALVAKRPFPWRAAALWAVLIAGVLVVVAMAVRLAREMGSQPS